MTEPAAALVIAARSSDAQINLSDTSGHKSLICLNGRTALSHVLHSLGSCALIGKVVVVSEGEAVRDAPGAHEHLRASGGQSEAVLLGLRAVQDSKRCVVMTGDMPLASAEALEDMLTQAPDADVVYPVVEKTVIGAAFPDLTPYYVRTQEGSFTGSTCLLVRPEDALREQSTLIRLLEARSNPASLLGLVGAGFAFRMMLSTLSIRDFEDTLSSALRLSCRVYESRHPELFVSIDSPEHLALIERELGGR